MKCVLTLYLFARYSLNRSIKPMSELQRDEEEGEKE